MVRRSASSSSSSTAAERRLDVDRSTPPATSRSCPTPGGSAGRPARDRPPTAPGARPSRRTGWPAGCEVSRPSSSGSTPIQMVGTPAASVTRSDSMSAARPTGDRSGPGMTGRRRRPPRRGRGPRRWRGTWARPAGRGRSRVGPRPPAVSTPVGVQERRPVRVDDALGVARGAARVAHRRGLVLVVDVGTRRARPRPAAPRSRGPPCPAGASGTSPAPSSMTTMWRTVSNLSNSGHTSLASDLSTKTTSSSAWLAT